MLYPKIYQFLLAISRMKHFEKLLIVRLKLMHLLKYGIDRKLISVLFNKDENKVIKHTGVGFSANRTLYFSSFYHYKNKVPKLFAPKVYDCLIGQNFFTKEILQFEGPKVFYTLEPNVVYEQTNINDLETLPRDTEHFSFLTHNTDQRLYYPALLDRKKIISQLEPRINQKRDMLCCIINRYAIKEGFSLLKKRIDFVSFFQHHIDIYGHKPWGEKNGWEEYSNYYGPCKDKIKTLQRYNFNLCFENSNHDGYITEKMIQSFIGGAIPLYWGGGAFLSETIPEDCFINCKNLDPKSVLKLIQEMPFEQIVKYRYSALQFLRSEKATFFTKKYFLNTIVDRLKKQL